MEAHRIATETAIRVVLVDDHEIARRGVRKLLGSDTSIEIVGEATTYIDAVSLVKRLKPNVVLLDIRLEEGNGIDVARSIKSTKSETKILVLTAHSDDQYVRAMARIGVNGYLIKTVTAEQLKKAIRDVAEGFLVFPDNFSSKMTNLVQNSGENSMFNSKGSSGGSRKPADMLSRCRNLTNREAEVFGHVACGLRNHEVASHMDIAVKTVEVHVRHILRKLGARNRTQAVLNANIHNWQ